KIGSLTIFDAKSTWMFVCAIASVIAQLIILGKEFKPVRLLQLLVAAKHGGTVSCGELGLPVTETGLEKGSFPIAAGRV
ncbi:MAG: hypothetical protein J6T79_05520, partial [Verrucomicrobia bacterium]|nr:hypothetical protein [Verrucomicrobiota bacterium]